MLTAVIVLLAVNGVFNLLTLIFAFIGFTSFARPSVKAESGSSPVLSAPAETEVQQDLRRRREQEEAAFAELMNYNVEKAYGINTGQMED